MKTPLEESPSSLSTHSLPPNTVASRPAARQNAAAAATSTLIEFPGSSARTQRPAWRKELSERVREIQERRAREATGDDANASDSYQMLDQESAAQGLGLVPTPPPLPVEERQLNPIVVAALARVERARRTPPPQPSPPTTTSQATAPAIHQPSATKPAATMMLAATPTSSTDAGFTEKTSELDAPAARDNSAQTANDSSSFVARTADADTAATREVRPRPATLGGVDLNSPAYLKHKQEEEARARAKALAAKQTSAVQTRFVTPARGNAIDSSNSKGTHANANPASQSRPSTGASVAGVEPSTPAPRTEPDATRSPKTATAAARDNTPTSTSNAATLAAARRVNPQVLDDAMIARLESEEAAAEAARKRKSQDDYAPFTARLTAGVIDAVSVVFLSSPIAAALELTNGNWSDSRTMMTMTISAITITFLYVTAATALAGRTWGMALVNLRAVDVESGMIPTTSQAVRRGAAYVVSLVLFGLGLLYALIDPERRGAHDHFSGTVVVRE